MTWGRFKNDYDYLNLRALDFQHCMKFHAKNPYPYIERYDFYTTLKLKSYKNW